MDLRIPKFIQLDKKNFDGRNIFKFLVEDISYHRFLQPKDIITIEGIDVSRVNPGDFVFGNNVISQQGVFQVIKKRIEGGETVLILKVEYNLYFDDKLYPQNLIGKLVSIQRNQHYLRFDTFVYLIQEKIEISLLLFRRKLVETIKIIHCSEIYSYFIKKVFSKIKFRYRFANIEDVPKIARLLMRHYWPMSIQEVKKKIYCLLSELQDSGYCFIACKKEKIIGFLVVKEEYSTNKEERFWYLDMLYVDFYYRRLRIGLKLSLFAFQEGVKRKICEFRGVSTNNIYPYVYKSLKTNKFISFIVEEKPIIIHNRLSCTQLNYILKITNPEMLMRCAIKE